MCNYILLPGFLPFSSDFLHSFAGFFWKHFLNESFAHKHSSQGLLLGDAALLLLLTLQLISSLFSSVHSTCCAAETHCIFTEDVTLISPEASAETALIGHAIHGIYGIKAMNLSKLCEIVKDREAWRAAVHGVTESGTLSDSNNPSHSVSQVGEEKGERK